MVLTTSSNFSKLAQEAHSLAAALNSLKSEYVSSLDTYNSKIGSVSLSSWSDEVSSKLDSLLGNLKGDFYNTMSNEITTGNFSILVSSASQLADKLDECAASVTKVAEEQAKMKAYLDTHKEGYVGIGDGLKNAQTTLESNVRLANDLIRKIESLQFGSTAVVVPDYEAKLVDVDNNRDSWYDVVSMTYAGDPFGYKTYGDVTIIIHKGQVVFYRYFENGKLQYYDANHNPLTDEQVSSIKVSYGAQP